MFSTLKWNDQQTVWETHARSAWNSFRGQEAVREGQEQRSMLLEDPLEMKNYPNLVWVERRIRLENSSLGKRKK